MSKKQNTTALTFSCLGCGSPYIVYPPDSFHKQASLDANELSNPLKMTYHCKICYKENVLYWGNRKISIAVG